MAEASKAPKAPMTKAKLVFVLVGVGLLLVGLVCLGVGLAPLKQLMDAIGPVFSGGAPPEDLSERMDASFAALKGRAVFDVLGFIGVLGGFVLVKVGLAPPKPKTVDELVEEAVEQRMKALGALAPAPVPGPVMTPAPRSVPAPAPSAAAAPVAAGGPAPSAVPLQASRSCPKCGGRLAAGGRICLACRSTFP